MVQEAPKFKKIVDAAEGLSLGISMVVAILIGIGIGLQKLTGIWWTLWIGVFIGVYSAILNVYKAYAKQKGSLDKLAKDPGYTYKQEQQYKYDDKEEKE